MRLYLIFTLFIFLFVNSFAKDFKDFIKEGDTYYEQFDNLSAVKSYEQAYKLAPGDFDVLLKLSRTYNDLGEEYYELRKRDESEKYINKAIEFSELFQKKYSKKAEPYCYLAMAYGNIAMFKGGKEKIKYAKLVEENAKKSIKLDSKNYVPYIILGIYYRELSKLNWIERAFANTFLGGVPEGSIEDSEKMFKKALALDDNVIVSVYQLAKTYREMELEKEEISLLKKIIDMPMRDFRDKFAKNKAKRRLDKIIAEG